MIQDEFDDWFLDLQMSVRGNEELVNRGGRLIERLRKLTALHNLDDDHLIDNAGTCSQCPDLNDDHERPSSLRECIKLNVCAPLRVRIVDLELTLMELKGRRNK